MKISVVHYEENGFEAGNLEWAAGGDDLTNPTIPLVGIPAIPLVKTPALLIDESDEGLEVFDVSSDIDTSAEVNDLKFVVRNNDLSNGKKTFTDHIFVTVQYSE